jgi:hypothetical protein
MIYCVVPRELEGELYEKLVEHYRRNPNVEVILERRSGPDRRGTQEPGQYAERRETRDRRRGRALGTFPKTEAFE